MKHNKRWLTLLWLFQKFTLPKVQTAWFDISKVWPLLLTDPGCVFACGRVWDFTTGQGAVDPVGILCVRGGGRGSVCWPLADLCPVDPRCSGGVRAELQRISLTLLHTFLFSLFQSVQILTDMLQLRSSCVCVYVVCVVCYERNNDRQTAGRESADGLGPHTRPLLPSFCHSECIVFGTSQLQSISLQLSRLSDGGANTCGKTSWKCAVSHLGHSIVLWKRWDSHQLQELITSFTLITTNLPHCVMLTHTVTLPQSWHRQWAVWNFAVFFFHESTTLKREVNRIPAVCNLCPQNMFTTKKLSNRGISFSFLCWVQLFPLSCLQVHSLNFSISGYFDMGFRLD